MRFEELIAGYHASEDKKHGPRQVGRYWCSEIYAMDKGYKTPANFFLKRKETALSQARMFSGKLFEAGYRMLLEANGVEFEYEPRKVIKIAPGVTLTVKPDFIIQNKEIHECKLIFRPMRGKYDYQLEAEHRAFGLPVKAIILSFPFWAEPHEFKPSDARWQKIQEIVIDFDKRLRDGLKKDKPLQKGEIQDLP
jgi:hypothetical protein